MRALEEMVDALLSLPDIRELPVDASQLFRNLGTYAEWKKTRDSIFELTTCEEIPHVVREMVRHDIGNLSTYLDMQIMKYEERSAAQLADRLGCLAALRALGLAIPYVVTGDEAYREEFDMHLLPTLMRTVAGDKVIEFDLSKDGVFSNAAFYAISQLAKNAGYCRVFAKDYGEFSMMGTQDNGTGFVHEDGRPLTADELPAVFSTFSTTGGGLGLQIVKQIVELEGGYATIETTANETLWYDTRLPSAERLETRKERGSTVTLYIPSQAS